MYLSSRGTFTASSVHKTQQSTVCQTEASLTLNEKRITSCFSELTIIHSSPVDTPVWQSFPPNINFNYSISFKLDLNVFSAVCCIKLKD